MSSVYARFRAPRFVPPRPYRPGRRCHRIVHVDVQALTRSWRARRQYRVEARAMVYDESWDRPEAGGESVNNILTRRLRYTLAAVVLPRHHQLPRWFLILPVRLSTSIAPLRPLRTT